jgi:hypothetical protein
MDKIVMKAFQAPKEPELCAEFMREHRKVLEDFGITNVLTNGAWQQDEHCYVIVAMHEQLGMVGGIRLQIDHDGIKLPVEEAVGKLDEGIKPFLEDLKPYGNGEVCGLWNANRYSGKGIPVLLSLAVTAISSPVGAKRMVCLVAPYTKRHPSHNGFVVVESVGDKGVFAYPRPDFKGIVMLNPDTLLLTHALPVQRHAIYSLRLRPEQTRVECPSGVPLEVEYRMQMNTGMVDFYAFEHIRDERLRFCA